MARGAGGVILPSTHLLASEPTGGSFTRAAGGVLGGLILAHFMLKCIDAPLVVGHGAQLIGELHHAQA